MNQRDELPPATLVDTTEDRDYLFFGELLIDAEGPDPTGGVVSTARARRRIDDLAPGAEVCERVLTDAFRSRLPAAEQPTRIDMFGVVGSTLQP